MKQDVELVHKWLKIAGKQFGNKADLPLSIKVLKEEVQEVIDGVNNNDEEEILDGLVDSFFVLHNVSLAQGISPERIEEHFNKVISSNYSKYCKTEEEAIDSVLAYKEGTHPNKLGEVIDTYYEKTEDKDYPFVIKRKDGKILKSINFIEPK